MKYILNLRNKTNDEVSSLIDNAGFPAIIGGGQKNEPVKLFIEDTEAELLELIGSGEPNFEEVFDITYATGSGSGSGSGSDSGSGNDNDEQQ